MKLLNERYEMSDNPIFHNTENITYLINNNDRIKKKMLRRCDKKNIIDVYKLLLYPDEGTIIYVIQSMSGNNIFEFYKSIKNKTDRVNFFAIKYCKINEVVSIFKLIKNLTEKIISCAIKRFKINEDIMNDANFYEEQQYIIELYNFAETFSDLNKFELMKRLLCDEKCEYTFKMIIHKTDDMIIYMMSRFFKLENKIKIYKLVLNSNSATEEKIKKHILEFISHENYDFKIVYKEFLLSREYIPEYIYMDNYDILGCKYFNKVINPSENFWKEIIDKNWTNLSHISKKFQTISICKYALKKCCCARIFIKINLNNETKYNIDETELTSLYVKDKKI